LVEKLLLSLESLISRSDSRSESGCFVSTESKDSLDVLFVMEVVGVRVVVGGSSSTVDKPDTVP